MGQTLVWQGEEWQPGTAPGDRHYVHTQSTPSSSWTIRHELGKHPAVTVVDSGGTEWVAEVQHLSEQELVARFSNPFSGVAYLN